MKVEVVNIGDELLIGQVINSNAAFIAQQLTNAGFTCTRLTTVGDTEQEIIGAIENTLEDTKILIFSGGLGPTKDDLTKPLLADYFNTPLTFHQEAYDDIVALFSDRDLEVTEPNRLQAMLPKGTFTIPNAQGTARGLWFENKKLVVIALPGVPYEMKTMMVDCVIPRLQQQFNTTGAYFRTVMTAGLGESFLAARIAAWENNLAENMKLAYLPQPGIVRLRITCNGATLNQSKEKVNRAIDELQLLIPDLIYGFDELSLEEHIGLLMKEKGLTLSTAESCTGGYIAHLITRVPGSSAFFKGGVVAYDNTIKASLLAVSSHLLEQHGAVSEAVVKSMAEGARKALNSDVAISSSGIAGPTGGTAEKPVGTVWVAIATPTETVAQCFHMGEHRERTIRRTALSAFNMLRKVV